ncbi:MAG TPA: hypothetical protein VFK94_06410 [Patescibacteria group bacterium]|nr:hypothetical protein [Patescibacteria group bacterium]
MADEKEKTPEELEKEYIKAGSITITAKGAAAPSDEDGKRKDVTVVFGAGGPGGAPAAYNMASIALSDMLGQYHTSERRQAALAAKAEANKEPEAPKETGSKDTKKK